MPDTSLRIRRAGPDEPGRRPVMIAIAGDSAEGKTTLTWGLVEALGPDRCVSLCADDHHRYDRAERTGLPFTALHPECPGRIGDGRSEPLAIAQLLLFYHLRDLDRSRP